MKRWPSKPPKRTCRTAVFWSRCWRVRPTSGRNATSKCARNWRAFAANEHRDTRGRDQANLIQLMFSFQAARNMLLGRTEEVIRTLEGAIREGDEAIAEGRDAIQGLHADAALAINLEDLLTAARKELGRSCGAESEPPA